MRTDGYLFMLDRSTGKAIWPVEERPVPQNARLKTAPTQPFPVGAEQLGPRCMSPEYMPAGFRGMCQYDPVDYDIPNAIYPILTLRSSPLAYSPKAQYIFAAGSPGWPLWLRRYENPRFFNSQPSVPGLRTFGVVAAIDTRTNKIAWQRRTPYEIQNGSGFAATAGDLLFHGEPDGFMQALDAATGKVLWQFQTGANVQGAAITYELDGDQYVVAAAANTLWAFKLGGDLPQMPAPTPPKTGTTFSGRIVATEEIGMSATIKDSGLGEIREAYEEYIFQPVRSKASVGAKITWVNRGKEPHSAAALDGSWTTGEVKPGALAVITFRKPGTYIYHCKEHPWTYGEITIEQD